MKKMRLLFVFLLLPLFAVSQQSQPASSSTGSILSKHGIKQVSPVKSQHRNMVQGDTLYITSDTLITGNWSFAGTVVALDTGKVWIQNATMVLPGDLVVFGNDAVIDIQNSNISQPQQYFYQRSVVCTGNGLFRAENSTLNYNGLSHNMVIAENGRVELIDVTTQGFRTCGLSENASLLIDGINQAGEFIMTDSCNISISHAATVLLWHYIQPGAVMNMSFPDGDTLDHYDFGPASPGVSGFGYQVEIDTCTEVLWGLMPDRNTDVTISNSTLRTIGLWFTGSANLDISGLVNQTTYANQTMNIADRNLTLQACSVRTWSLYMFDTVSVDVSSCIVGEIGTFGYSTVTTNTVLVDGSGGYFFANDNSICIAGYTTTSSSVRSQHNGIMLYANSNVMLGSLEATEQSVLIVTQSSIPQDPVYYAEACAWLLNIEGPYSAYYGQNYEVFGSAWIDKDPASPLMDFGQYQLFYSTDMGTSWIAIDVPQNIEKRHEKLDDFNTALLPSEGTYLLKLSLTDNQATPFTIDAVVQLSVLPSYLAVSESELAAVIYPNPASDKVMIELSDDGSAEVVIYSQEGKPLIRSSSSEGNKRCLDVSMLTPGVYYVQVTGESIFTRALVIE